MGAQDSSIPLFALFRRLPVARTTSHKDSLASFVWTMGAADMVIGGVGERGSLFAFGLLTVGAGFLVGWLRQRRLGNAPFPTRPRGASAFLAKRLRSTRFSVSPRTRRRGNPSGDLRTPNYYAGRSAEPPFRRSSSQQGARQVAPQPPQVSRSANVNSAVRPQSSRRSPQPLDPSAPQLQGPPLNLPPAPRPRSRRGRRIY